MGKTLQRQHHDEHVDESWLIPYADLLTLLLALFIVLFASSQLDAKKYGEVMASLQIALKGGNGLLLQDDRQLLPPKASSPLQSEETISQGRNNPADQQVKESMELEALKNSLDTYISDNGLTPQLETSLDENQLRIVINDSALFELGSAAIEPGERELGKKIAELLVQYPDYQVLVTGHTDNLPVSNHDFDSNWELSAKRAINFMKVILENERLDRKRFSAVGQGEFRPVASNDTPEGRAMNRRVEVSIMRTVKPVPVIE